MSIKFVIGADPGVGGGIALMDRQLNLIDYCEITNFKKTRDLILKSIFDDMSNEVISFIEDVKPIKGTSCQSTFSFGRSKGIVEGILNFCDIKVRYLDIKEWKRYYGLSSDKTHAINLCKEYYPDIKLIPNSRCKVENDNIAEAVLIARRGCTILDDEGL